MFPQNDRLITALITIRQDELRRERERDYLIRAARAARPSVPRRPAALLQRIRRWSSGIARLPAPCGAHAAPEERWSA